jgi:hypothetical protein
VDPDKRRAISDFYREEFVRHFERLETPGVVSDLNREAVGRAYRKVMGDLDAMCSRDDFRLVAEQLLQQFDVLTHLSELDPRRGH